MKKCVILGTLLLCAIPVVAHSSAENILKKASDLETWRQQLRYYEQQLGEREQTVFGKLEESQQQYQQGMQHAAEREETLRRQLQQQQEHVKNQAFHTQLQQQQEEARRRETALQRQLEAQQERKAFERLQQGKQLSTLQHQLQEQQSQASGQQPQQANAYGYADKTAPSAEGRTASSTQESTPLIGAAPQLQAAPQAPSHTVILFETPEAIPTIAPLNTNIRTTVNGIDQIETHALFSEALTVEQLQAVDKIADNGVVIAQQRFGLEQFSIDATTRVSRLRVIKGFALWGLLLSIPSVLILYWIVRHIALGWREWQQEKLSYKLKELEGVERQLSMTERQFDADHQR